MVNAQEWFDRKYPKNIRNIITEIKIDAFELHKKEKLKKEEYLESSLKIENFPNLKNFDCCNNKITELEFINCSELEKIRCCNNRLDLLNIKNLPNLKKLNCSDNFLTTIDLSSNIKLEELDLGDNGFEKQNLFFLSHLINLENLDLGNRDRGSYMHFYNQFYGSLKPLQNLNKLQKLDISNTDIDRGLKYLPVSVNFFNCRAEVEWLNLRGRSARVKYLSKEAHAKEETQEGIKDRIKFFLPHYNLTEKLSKLIYEAKSVNTLEGYKELVKKMPFNDVCDSVGSEIDFSVSTHIYFSKLEKIIGELEELQKIENNRDYRDKVKDEIREKIIELLSKISEIDEIKNSINSLKSQLNKLEINFEQQLKGQKVNWSRQIKQKRTEITKALSNKKGGSAYIHKEIKSIQDKISDYEKLVKELQLSKNMLIIGNKVEEVIEDQEYLNDSLQELQREDNEPVWEGFCQVLKRAEARWERAEETSKNINKKDIKEKIKELKKHINFAQKLTQKLLGDQQLEVQLVKAQSEKLVIVAEIENQINPINQDPKQVRQKAEELTQWQITAEKPTLERVIGKGGFGEVHYGEWKLQDVAVKKLFVQNNISDSDIKEITNEINILKNLRNRYIIQYYGTYSDEQELLIIMDYAENGTLTKFINENKEHDWNFNSELIKQMALGLAYIHHEDIIHRDLKSLNILLTKNNEVKISDFGLSRIKNITSQTQDIKGSLKWMAPETLKEKKFSEQSDIYALGMIIWEIVAKSTTPFKEVDFNLVAIHIINGGKENIPNDVPKNIRNIIEKCWKDNPGERISLEKIVENIRLVQPIEIKHLSESKSLESEQTSNNSELDLNINNFNLEESEESKISSNQEESWENINFNFTQELISQWTNHNFTYSQTQNWINTGLKPTDYKFATWLRDEVQTNPIEFLNDSSRMEDLREQFNEYQTHIEQLPKS